MVEILFRYLLNKKELKNLRFEGPVGGEPPPAKEAEANIYKDAVREYSNFANIILFL